MKKIIFYRSIGTAHLYHAVPCNTKQYQSEKANKFLFFHGVISIFICFPSFPGLFVCWCGLFVLWGVLWAFPGRLVRGCVLYGLSDSGAVWAFCGAVLDVSINI